MKALFSLMMKMNAGKIIPMMRKSYSSLKKVASAILLVRLWLSSILSLNVTRSTMTQVFMTNQVLQMRKKSKQI